MNPDCEESAATLHHLVVFGLDEIVVNKYLPCIENAVAVGQLDGYSVVDLACERAAVEARLAQVSLKPRQACYLPSRPLPGTVSVPPEVVKLLDDLTVAGPPIRAYIATEVSAHETYLRFCLERGIDCLVEKPAIAPLENGRFAANRLTTLTEDLSRSAARTGTSCSVMTLSRYHAVYNDRIVDGLRTRVAKYGAPVSSLHLRAAGGVWNRLEEFSGRQDHAYTFGYGMLMHGAYHYVDLASQILELNAQLEPDRAMELVVSAFGAYPHDQVGRVPNLASRAIDDAADAEALSRTGSESFGETDIVAAFALNDAATGRRITLGTLSFEQTTPSVRSWRNFPPNLYNKNGRTSSVDLEAQLSTLYTAHVHCYDIPRTADADKIDAFARITTRANATLLPEEEYVTTTAFDGLFHSDSNRQLMTCFLAGREVRSRIDTHIAPTKITQALASAILQPGTPVVSSFP